MLVNSIPLMLYIDKRKERSLAERCSSEVEFRLLLCLVPRNEHTEKTFLTTFVQKQAPPSLLSLHLSSVWE